MRKSRVVAVLLLSGFLGFLFGLWHARPQINEREGIETFHSPSTMVRQLEGDPLAGKKIFQAFCAVCHGAVRQIDINAPRIGDHKAWKPFLHLGPKTLLQITIHGAGAMPAAHLLD